MTASEAPIAARGRNARRPSGRGRISGITPSPGPWPAQEKPTVSARRRASRVGIGRFRRGFRPKNGGLLHIVRFLTQASNKANCLERK